LAFGYCFDDCLPAVWWPAGRSLRRSSVVRVMPPSHVQRVSWRWRLLAHRPGTRLISGLDQYEGKRYIGGGRFRAGKRDVTRGLRVA
jgi:hypothetical protein